jgi:hypothetical protein
MAGRPASPVKGEEFSFPPLVGGKMALDFIWVIDPIFFTKIRSF